MPGIENGEPERTETSSGSLIVAEPLAHLLLEKRDVGRDLLGKTLGESRRRGVVVLHARLTGDGESGRNGEPETGHLSEVRALAPELELHLLAAFGSIPAEGVHALEVRQFRLLQCR